MTRLTSHRFLLFLFIWLLLTANSFTFAQEDGEEEDTRLPITWYTHGGKARQIATSYNETSVLYRIDVISLPETDPLDHLLDALQQGEVDILDIDASQYDQLINTGLIANMDPWIQRDPAIRRWQYYLDLVRDERGQFVIPLNRVTFHVYAHAHMLSESGFPLPPVGWTWDDYWSLAGALASPESGRFGVAIVHGGAWRLPFLQQGYDIFTSPYDHFRSGLQMMYNILHVQQIHEPPSGARSAFQLADEAFLNHRAATAVATGAFAQRVYATQHLASGLFATARTSLPPQTWVTMPLPVPHANVPSGSVGSLSYFVGMATTSHQPAAAWEIMRWLTSADGAAALLTNASMMPVFMHDEVMPLAVRLHGDGAHEFFREPFLLDRSFRPSPYEAQLLSALDRIGTDYFLKRLSLDEAIQSMEMARDELRRLHNGGGS